MATTNKTMTELAFELISKKKKPTPFGKLWADVSKKLKLDSDDIGYFYQELNQDGRFVSVENNEWTLKNRVKNLKISETDLSLLSVEELVKMCEDYGLDYEEGKEADYYIDLLNSVDEDSDTEDDDEDEESEDDE